MSLNTLLIANRGEIACRIIASASRQGLRTVAVYSDADAEACHVRAADHAVAIGAAPSSDSYLSIERLVEAALQSGADGVHPGYGFLSENADFARAVIAAGLIFVGPPADAIELMGDKAEAKRLMEQSGVACVPGYHGADQSSATLLAAASQIGYPLMVKAAAGGGGRGMRRVQCETELQQSLEIARAEAASAFGSQALILEREVARPRHVEIQVFADQHGHCIHLGERDCSLQRRHQKVVEEAPCVALNDTLRAQMGDAAVAVARAVNYVGAGTVEFLLDADDHFYFIEMNTRLQVEHPVTEMITGLDLVALQLSVASGERLPLTQSQLQISGHAIEARLYAEDPADNFLPSIAVIDCWRPAQHAQLRIDAGVASGQAVTPYYDPLLAKVIAWGETREIARRRLLRGLADTILLGPASNIHLLADILQLPDFINADTSTATLADNYPDGIVDCLPLPAELALVAALCMRAEQRAAQALAIDVADNLLGWSSAALTPVPLQLLHRQRLYELRLSAEPEGWLVQGCNTDQPADSQRVVLQQLGEFAVQALVDDHPVRAFYSLGSDGRISFASDTRRFNLQRPLAASAVHNAAADGGITAPMPGLLIELSVAPDQRVRRGELLAVMEAMKMQHRITAPADAQVTQVYVASGAQLGSGDLIMTLTFDAHTGAAKETSG